MAVDILSGGQAVAGAAARAQRRPWALPQYLALVALPILGLEIWTVGSWLLDGPHQITQYREPGHGREWWGARGFEALVIVLSIWVVTKLVRDCREKGRLLTFDVMFCIVGATLIWVNAGNNFFQPMFTISSAFVNLNDTCGHNPLVVNPDCGRFANPVIFLGLFEVFGLLACSMLLGVVVRKVRERRPGISTAKLFAIACATGCALVLGEPAVLLPLHLWTFPGTPISVEIGGHGMRYPFFPEILVFGLWIGIIGSIRVFRDDQGRAFMERGIEHYTRPVRIGVTMLAMYAVVQLSTWAISTAPMWALGFHQQQWPALPSHLQNGLCDGPGVSGTRYGPCPGSPGFRMPVRDSLPGDSP